MSRPFSLVGIFGIITLMAGIWVGKAMQGVAFSLPAGFHNPTLALEFMRNPQDWVTMFAGEGLAAKIAAVQEMLNRDNMFLVVYTILLAAFIRVVYQETQSKKYLWSIILVFMAAIFDRIENFQTIEVLNNFIANSQTPVQIDINRVLIFAWLKWMTLLFFFHVLRSYLKTTNFVGKLLAVLVWPIGVIAIVGIAGNYQASDWFATSITMILLPLLIVFSLSYSKPVVKAD
ncbi:MAG: hypothetical protein IPL65_03005 [Lewinellaceae bacterium]|nr:hypothetical protein [Lewinellaceae bacterium]